MRGILFAAAIAVAVPTAVHATTWVAICNDGQRVQYNQTLGGNGLLYLKTPTSPTLQMARLEQTSRTRTMICGAIVGNSPASLVPPLSQMCIDRTANVISLKWHDARHPADPVHDMGAFCSATISVH